MNQLPAVIVDIILAYTGVGRYIALQLPEVCGRRPTPTASEAYRKELMLAAEELVAADDRYGMRDIVRRYPDWIRPAGLAEMAGAVGSIETIDWLLGTYAPYDLEDQSQPCTWRSNPSQHPVWATARARAADPFEITVVRHLADGKTAWPDDALAAAIRADRTTVVNHLIATGAMRAWGTRDESKMMIDCQRARWRNKLPRDTRSEPTIPQRRRRHVGMSLAKMDRWRMDRAARFREALQSAQNA